MHFIIFAFATLFVAAWAVTIYSLLTARIVHEGEEDGAPVDSLVLPHVNQKEQTLPKSLREPACWPLHPRHALHSQKHANSNRT